tara:strand:+ start:841 stop:1911 length:1071 start_codon:yes stop_codon:yes gene_type:complete
VIAATRHGRFASGSNSCKSTDASAAVLDMLQGRAILAEHTQDRGFRTISTRVVPERDRFDFWRSLFPRVHLDVGGRGQRSDFNGRLLSFTGEKGASFSFGRYSDTVARFARPDGKFILMSLAVAGGARVADAKGKEFDVSPETGVAVVDGTRPITTHSRNHAQFSLVIPRVLAIDALEQDEGLFDRGIFSLADSGLARMFAAQLGSFAREAEFLDRRGAELVMGGLVDIALGALAGSDRRAGSYDTAAGAALFGAAMRFIELNFDDPHLTAATIAHDLGCSRARLFRVFERRGQAVAFTIRKCRMARAIEMIAGADFLSVDQIAYRCGYRNASAFTRAFRLHVGIAPLDYRNRLPR